MGHKLKTEHNGAKNGGGAWTRRADAKAESKSLRRANDKKEVENEGQEILEEGFHFCPTCGGETYELGKVGMRVYFRCRFCGIDSSVVPAKE